MGDNDSLLNGALSFLLALSVSLSITLSAFKEVEAVAVPIVAIVGLVSLCVVVAWRLYGKGRY